MHEPVFWISSREDHLITASHLARSLAHHLSNRKHHAIVVSHGFAAPFLQSDDDLNNDHIRAHLARVLSSLGKVVVVIGSPLKEGINVARQTLRDTTILPVGVDNTLKKTPQRDKELGLVVNPMLVGMERSIADILIEYPLF